MFEIQMPGEAGLTANYSNPRAAAGADKDMLEKRLMVPAENPHMAGEWAVAPSPAPD